MPNKSKRQKIKAEFRRNKLRARYRKVIYECRGSEFDLMINELYKLNIKYLQQLLTDLKSGYYFRFWSGELAILQYSIETNILERTILK